jgi:uncharacterized protein (TIGR02217 family)
MATAFDEVRFPTDISYGSEGGPEFSTDVVELGSGYETRNINWTYPRERWNVAYGVKTRAQLQSLLAFFMARKGRAVGFRFKNHDDFEGATETLGTGDGVETEFQLYKHYVSGSGSLTRKITKPVDGTLHIFIDGDELSPISPPATVNWTVDSTTGIVTFTNPPAEGEVVTATFEFDIPARFDTDHLAVNLAAYLARAATVPVIEIRR